MNKMQIESALRIALAAGGPVAALILKYTGLSLDDYTMWVQVALLIIPPVAAWVWGYLSHTAVAQVESTRELPGVATVVVKDGTRGALGEVAADPAHPDIVTESQNEADAKRGGFGETGQKKQ